jgi:hypothetical protein
MPASPQFIQQLPVYGAQTVFVTPSQDTANSNFGYLLSNSSPMPAPTSTAQAAPISPIPEEGQLKADPMEFAIICKKDDQRPEKTPIAQASRLIARRGSESDLEQPKVGQIYSSDMTTGLQQRRRRSAFIEDLSFQQMLECPGNRYSCIRVWTDARGRLFYDCSCGHRKAVQDLKKIQRHAERHQILYHECNLCGKRFQRPLQLNAHKRIHRIGAKKEIEDHLDEEVVDSGVIEHVMETSS